MNTPTLPATFDASGTASSISGIERLDDFGVIRVTGEDAVKFLQGQLTQDVALMGMNEARLAAFCSAKGRMQASFIVFKRSGDEILMICSKSLLAQTLKRLSMFVLRAKARPSDATADFMLYGLAGDAIKKVADSAGSVWTKVESDTANVIFIYPADGIPRALWCAPAGTPAPEGPALPGGVWQWLDVRSGIAMVTLPVFEAFVPQMLNYESVGGVNFKKGCYPGQEIVARSQFRGTIKRRAYLAHCSGQLEVAQEVFHAASAEQPCGLIAACAANPNGGFDAIIAIQTAAAADAGGGKLTAGSPAGPALELLPLPYALLEDI